MAHAALNADQRQTEQTLTSVQEQAALLSVRAERLTAELERLNRALAVSAEELAQRDTVIIAQQDRIEALDSALKKKLLERVEELEKYASDFFGRLREVFAGNPDIVVVGDRFVFQSEVLFGSGEATLSANGRGDLDKFAAVYRQLATQLPPDLPVIIEVQGHTDRVPIRGRFPSNWELSTARAQEVVNYLILQGVPPERLAAVGMAEYHPIDPNDTPEAYRRNRRIELKITSR
jgi:chemotaxis protein MotB